MFCQQPRLLPCVACWIAFLIATGAVAAEQDFSHEVAPLFQEYCIDCHGDGGAEAHVNLEQLISAPDYATRFRTWEKIAKMVREKRMPPADVPQPGDAERRKIAGGVDRQLNRIANTDAGDPGRVVMRRLTSAEYTYTINDLTGLDIGLESILIGDAVGGEGFTNVGDVQFVQDSTLDRYLEAATLVASHAVIGTGPLEFFNDPGKTGFELSAIRRIHEIYRKHGFRTAAGEGGEAFGLDLYPRAFFIAWRYRHRHKLELGDLSLPELALNEGLDVRFTEHIWRVVNQDSAAFPTSEIVATWKQLPQPTSADESLEWEARQACHEMGRLLRNWQKRLAHNAGDDEEAALLTEGSIHLGPNYSFQANIDWAAGAKQASVLVSVGSATGKSVDNALVIWQKPMIQFRQMDRRRSTPVPLIELLPKESEHRSVFGQQDDETAIGEYDFVIAGDGVMKFEFAVPAGAIAARLTVEAELDKSSSAGCIVRCAVQDGSQQGDTAADTGEVSAMLGVAEGKAFEAWKASVLEFARLLPEISHREPAPSDRDPIPPPYDNSYNNSERNGFHYSIKYHRHDDFLVRHILDDSTRETLDHAWNDLLSSFDYHDTYLQFIAEKCGLDLRDQTIGNLLPDWVATVPDESRSVVRGLVNNYIEIQAALQVAEPRHIEDALQFARLAWRRPITATEKDGLREFYAEMRESQKLGHVEAIRALLTRILAAPAFLYRVESPQTDATVARLSPFEFASRMSYFLWSSPPDPELTRAAVAGELDDEEILQRHTLRMLQDPRARRFATEFFGQWFGFYRFDNYRGVDADRFTEFSDALQSAMYEEATSFFEHVVREDRPVSEILFADYSFLNQDLARHYGMRPEELAKLTPQTRFVASVDDFHRGGLLRLGAIHTSTSAPLRTSAVKRGDWILRRVLGTPVPPPPADVGSIPADDVLADGKTVRERLVAHRQDAACVNCHSRMDPLGFALENFDPIGRYREHYRDGQPIDASGTLNDGTHIAGLDGLRKYLHEQQSKFYRTMCSKLLGYALGRREILSDKLLIEQMLVDIKDDGRFSKLAVRIVASPQFRTLRGHTVQLDVELPKGNEDDED